MDTKEVDLNYKQVYCPHLQNKDAAALALGLKLRQLAQKSNCVCLAAPQVGMDKHVAVVRSITRKNWEICGNLYISKIPNPDNFTMYNGTLINFPCNYVILKVYQSIEVTYDELLTEKSVDNLKVSGNEAMLFQYMTALLDGTKLDIRPRDYRTLHNSDKAPRRNSICNCGSGLKYKRCCGG